MTTERHASQGRETSAERYEREQQEQYEEQRQDQLFAVKLFRGLEKGLPDGIEDEKARNAMRDFVKRFGDYFALPCDFVTREITPAEDAALNGIKDLLEALDNGTIGIIRHALHHMSHFNSALDQFAEMLQVTRVAKGETEGMNRQEVKAIEQMISLRATQILLVDAGVKAQFINVAPK